MHDKTIVHDACLMLTLNIKNLSIFTMKTLTPKEETIMHHYWTHGTLHIKQLQALYDDPKPHINTLSTMVHMLEDKGFLTHKVLSPRKFEYYPAISLQQYKDSTLAHVINKFYDKSGIAAVSALITRKLITIDQLKALVDNG